MNALVLSNIGYIFVGIGFYAFIYATETFSTGRYVTKLVIYLSGYHAQTFSKTMVCY